MSTTGRMALVALLAIGMARAGSPPARSAEAPGDVIKPIAPRLPGDLLASIEEGRYDDAASAISKLEAAAKGDDVAYYQLLRGIALRAGGKPDQAREALTAALTAAPKGPWSAKLRSEMAAVELATGHPDRAEALASAQAETLLAGDRKDRLAQVYLDFARRFAKPDNPITPANPEAAYGLLERAREIAQGGELRARILFEMGQASQQASNPGRAIQNYQDYLKEFADGADRIEARYLLGASQIAANQGLNARLTWSDLARELEGKEDPKATEFRPLALSRIAQTYGIPNPPDDTALNLGVAASRRYLEAYPRHKHAVEAAYNIAAAYLARGKSQDALASLHAFLKKEGFAPEGAEADALYARLAMTATFQVGGVLQSQEKFAEAIAAWKGYLAQFPNGPQGADAQRAILEAELQIAGELLRHERFDEARKAWAAFVAANPLDPQVPALLYQSGSSYVAQKKFDDAIREWGTLLSKFPGTEPAGHAQYDIASIYESEKGDLDAAIDRYRKVEVSPWKEQSAQRIAVMEAKQLTVVTPRTFRSGEKPQLKIATRNLEKLTFSAYKLDAEAYFRKKHAMENVEALDIGLVAPDAEWVVDVPGYAKYKLLDQPFELKDVPVPGVYVVKVSDEKNLRATTLVVGSDVDAIVKTSKDQALVFAQDMKTGKGRAGARVLFSDGGEVFFEGTTGKDGVLLASWPKPRDPNTALDYLILDGGNVAGSGIGIPERVAQGLSARAYLYTDRPAYRPGQSANLRGIVREVDNGQYATREGQEYRLEVADSRGKRIVDRAIKLSPFGTFDASIPVAAGAPVGTYRIRLFQPGKSEFSGGFEVQSYQLEKIDLAIDLPKTVYFRGETIKGGVVAKYQYGTPLAKRDLRVRLPDGRILAAKTDDAGKFPFEFKTEGFAEEQALVIAAQLPRDNVAVASNVMLAIRGFSISLETTRTTYLDGEPFAVNVRAVDAQGKPSGRDLKLALLKRVTVAGRTAEREVSSVPVKTDPATGEAKAILKAEDEDGGVFIIRGLGNDQFGNAVVADREVTISGDKDETRLRILADRTTYRVGDEAKVRLHARGGGGIVLLCWEADKILQYALSEVKEGSNDLSWTVVGGQFPNFTLTAARMAGARFDEASLDVRVERDLKVAIKPSKPKVGPGEGVEVEVTTTDQMGKPIAAEVSLALVDEALLRRFRDQNPPIGPFFYNQTRTNSFSTKATNTFKYQPPTVPVEQALVDEQQRALALAGDEKAAKQVLDQLKLGENQGQQNSDGVVMLHDGSQAAARPNRSMMGMEALNVPAPAAAPPAGEPAGAEIEEFGAIAGAGIGGGGAGRKPARDAMDFFADSDAEANEGKDRRSGAVAFDTPADAAKPEAAKLYAMDSGAARSRNQALAKRKAGGEPSATRERFVETAYWNPSIVTDAQGKAKVTLSAPSALSNYRFFAKGVTGADTLVGQAESTLGVQRDFFVDLKAPSILTQGDKPRFSAQVHHAGVKGALKLQLKSYDGEKESVAVVEREIKEDGVEEVQFDPIEVGKGESVRLTLTGTIGEAQDELFLEVPIRPWGVQAIASAAGAGRDDATVFVGLPQGRDYDNPVMLIELSPSVRRLIFELALGRQAYPLDVRLDRCIFPPPPTTTIDRASDLLATASAIGYLRSLQGVAAPEASRLGDQARALVGELTSLQAEDGGWPLVPAAADKKGVGEPVTTARAYWALATVEPLGLISDPSVLEAGEAYLNKAFAQARPDDYETRVVILHALSARRKATFEAANSLNRVRQSLPDAALASLALTLANLDRKPLAGEVLEILAQRSKVGDKRRHWEGLKQAPWQAGPAETTALAALAYAIAKPDAPQLKESVDWLLANRIGTGWRPYKAKGPALAAIAAYYGGAGAAEDDYRLKVAVNDTQVFEQEIQGAVAGKVIPVPARAIKSGAPNRVTFDIEGRGEFGYSVILTGFATEFGPDQDRKNRGFIVRDRKYLAATPEFDGRPLPVGFGAALNAEPFVNKVTQAGLGGRAAVEVDLAAFKFPGQAPWDNDFLVVEEYLPAGTSLVEGSVQSSALYHQEDDGKLVFFFAPGQYPGTIRYELYGVIPGEYRALPTKICSAYDPGKLHLGPAGGLKVLSPGEAPNDPYRPTPDELLARGKALHELGRLPEAGAALEALSEGWTLNDEVAKEVARLLLDVYVKDYDPRKVVRSFEVLKEKAPELEIPFDKIKIVGKAYRDIGEFERSYLVWRAVAEASYLEDVKVGEVLRQQGKTLEGIALLVGLWRESPGTASIESDFFGVSQLLANLATQAIDNPQVRRELAEAGVTRSQLLLQSIRLAETFLALSPKNPIADEASLSLVGGYLELEDYQGVVRLAQRYAKLFPKSKFLDSFQYSEALGRFHLGEYDRAVEVAEAISKAVYKDESGADTPSPNKWQAIYILGQIFDARRQPAKAVEYYDQVADRFTDAAMAAQWLKRKALELPEVSVIRPSAIPAVGFRAVDAEPPKGEKEKSGVDLKFRNLAAVDVKVYPVDLMRLYLTRRNLDGIAGIDLAGITPLHQGEEKLGDGNDFEDKDRRLNLPLEKEGAYLVMTRGENLYASGIVLVSPIEMLVQEEAGAGRVRVTVRDARTKAPLPKVQVKVIGTNNPAFFNGETDLRGVYVAEGVLGTVTAVARRDQAQYAFHRGTTFVGQPAAPAGAPSPEAPAQAPQPAEPNQSLEGNIKSLNIDNQNRQMQRLQERFNREERGVKVQEAY